MNHFFHWYSIIFLVSFSTMYGANIFLYASSFNATYSCNNPLVLDGTVTIILDEDIIIDQCMPFVAGPQLTSADQLIFSSTTNHKVIIKTNTVIDLSSFLPQQQDMLFTETATLVVEEGAYIIFGQNRLVANQNARISFVKSNA